MTDWAIYQQWGAVQFHGVLSIGNYIDPISHKLGT